MELEIRKLRKKDAKKAIEFAIVGMHFNWYMDNKLLLNLPKDKPRKRRDK